MKILRLLLFSECNRACVGCCNSQWDLQSLPVNDSFREYDQIILTGGEPMLHPDIVVNTCIEIRRETNVPIFMYTAKIDRPLEIIALFNWLDGITVTLHEHYDIIDFMKLQNYLERFYTDNKSLRLNVFDNVSIKGIDTYGWEVKSGIQWIPNCPLPENEVFKRLTY